MSLSREVAVDIHVPAGTGRAEVSGSVADSCGGRCPTLQLPDSGEAAAPQVAQFPGGLLGDNAGSSA